MVFDKIRLQVRRSSTKRWRAGVWGARGLLVAGLLGAGLGRAEGAKAEPGLLAVQRAALAHAGLSEGATNRLLARAHLSALLPQVRVTLGRGWQLSATGRPLDGLSAPTTVDNDHTSYAVSASWDLARLLVPHEALLVHNAAPRLAHQRLVLLLRVNGLYGARCHLLQQEPASPPERVAELEAALDLLTGGHPLPTVTAATLCPAVPRFTVAVPHSTPRPSTASRHRSAAGPNPSDPYYGEDDRLSEPSGLPGSAEGPEDSYGYE